MRLRPFTAPDSVLQVTHLSPLPFHAAQDSFLSILDVTFAVFYDWLLPQLAEMELGWNTKLKDDKDFFLIAGINVATQDLPQGNDKACIKRQNAGQGCRACDVSKEDLAKVDDLASLRLHANILQTRASMNGKSSSAIATMEKDTGILATASPFEQLSFDVCKLFIPALAFLPFFNISPLTSLLTWHSKPDRSVLRWTSSWQSRRLAPLSAV